MTESADPLYFNDQVRRSVKKGLTFKFKFYLLLGFVKKRIWSCFVLAKKQSAFYHINDKLKELPLH